MPIGNIKIWIRAARLRTLPLSMSGIIVGNALCLNKVNFSWLLFILMLATAICFQIVSNFANDYGDGVKGTDNQDRIGPERVLQAGLLTKDTLKKGIVGIASVAFIFAFILIAMAFGTSSWIYFGLFTLLTILSIWAAISYTVGQNAYGYSGFGDLFVFIFFGFVSVLGAYFLQMKEISLTAVAFAWVLGLLAVAVLNLNNMRDLESDRSAGKRTLAVILGPQQAKYYHYLLILSAVIILVFITIQLQLIYYWLSLLGIIPLAIHLFTIRSHIEPQSLDPELKKVALSVFAVSLLLLISFSLG